MPYVCGLQISRVHIRMNNCGCSLVRPRHIRLLQGVGKAIILTKERLRGPRRDNNKQTEKWEQKPPLRRTKLTVRDNDKRPLASDTHRATPSGFPPYGTPSLRRHQGRPSPRNRESLPVLAPPEIRPWWTQTSHRNARYRLCRSRPVGDNMWRKEAE